MTKRSLWFTDTFGATVDCDLSIERLDPLLDALQDSDEEHAAVSVTDSDEWNLEFTGRSVLFENVGDQGQEVGSLPLTDRSHALAIASEFLVGDFDALRAQPWVA